MARNTLPKKTLVRARQLRRDMTDAEIKLWTRLKGDQIDGFAFRRQAPIGPYFADFVCNAAQLIIEVDGGQHGEASAIAYDKQREDYLAGRGYRVLRFWNHDVLGNIDGVLAVIAGALNQPGSPTQPSPARGEGFSERPVEVFCDDEHLHVSLADGRALSAPLWWYPRLLQATPEQRAVVELMPMGIHWPDVDEDISIASILRGAKAPGARPL